jgi:hypothetical protein
MAGRGVTATSEQQVTEDAAIASALPDLVGFLKFASQPELRRVELVR